VSESYPEIEYNELIIDAGCMRLVQAPEEFDIILCENLYGDVLSDLCAGFVGGLGVTPGANHGVKNSVFEAVHGSAPDIAGRGIANPLALIMSGVMMLNHLHRTRGDENAQVCATRIRDAYDAALLAGACTADLGGTLDTNGFVQALIARMD
jgi:isocitrate dehydrogenase (NAD+)